MPEKRVLFMNVQEMLKDYQPINYDNWDESGKGLNILHLLSPLEDKIWSAALPFQDKRDDQGHAENVTYFALKLLHYFPTPNRNIVVPAAILHDTGWSQMTEVELKLFYIPNWKDYEAPLRANHQKKGVEVADKILTQIGYPQEFRQQILDIISEHDSRAGFLSVEDGIARDADKLWRYTLPHLYLTMKKRESSPEELRKRLYGDYFSKPGFFHSDISKGIGRIEFDHSMQVLQSNPKIIGKILEAVRK
jgi:hypothetical protein